MKKLFLTIALFLCLPVMADWKYITTESESESDFFLDFETLRKDGNVRRIWQLVNVKPGHKSGWGSIRSRVEFDCKNETSQGFSTMAFSEKFTGGKILFQSNTPLTKADIAPNTVASILLKEVCKK
jgi:hypothetical protein